jgi:methionyl-tRNA formyltransferase
MTRLADLGAQELVAALKGLSSGALVWHEQDEAYASYAKKIEKSEMLLRTKEPALMNLRRIRAATDAAPARFIIGKHGVRALSAQLVPPEDAAAKALAAGQLLFERGRVLLGCDDGALELLSVKPDGKRAMSASAWATGVHSALNWREA